MDNKNATGGPNNKSEIVINSCRICMTEEKEMNDIFDAGCDIVDKILYCTGLQFTKDDGLPSQLCQNCLKDLSIAHKFKSACLLANETFQNLLKIKTEDVSSEENDEEFVDNEGSCLEETLNDNGMENGLYFSCTEKNTEDPQDERNRNRKIENTTDENKKREEKLQKSRERSKRHREKKRNEDAALAMRGLTDADKEKREERLRYDREKSKRYREKKKIEVAALSMDATYSSSDFSSDSSSYIMKKERQKQNSKRYRDKMRSLNLLTPNISKRKNVSHSINSPQIAGPSTRDVPYVPPIIDTSLIAGPSTIVPYVLPIFYSSQIESISSRDVPNSSPINSKNNSTEN